MPNAFTPDGDGLNDLFFPEIDRALPHDFEFMIFNRQGNIVWETDDIEGKWDGVLSGDDRFAQTQMFIWKVMVRDLRAKLREFSGSVMLLR